MLHRWVGGRGIAQMSTVEFLLVIALGSAVGDAMFYPDVPLLHAMLVITLVVAINKGLDWLISRFKAVEKVIDGKASEMVRDGVIIVQNLRNSNIGVDELFMSLREQGYSNLGQVRQAYLETSGRFSTFRAQSPHLGLPIEPPFDVTPPELHGAGTQIDINLTMACCRCGKLGEDPGKISGTCAHCGSNTWTTAEMSQ